MEIIELNSAGNKIVANLYEPINYNGRTLIMSSATGAKQTARWRRAGSPQDGVHAGGGWRGYGRGNGNFVKVKHNGTYSTQYLHMSKIADGITIGKYVKQGEIIGYVGSTGSSSGNHVCYRFWKNGKQVDSRKQKFENAKPMDTTNLKTYMVYVDSVKPILDRIDYPILDTIPVKNDSLVGVLEDSI